MLPTAKNDSMPADDKEKTTLYIRNAIELALSLGDFQKEIQSECTSQTIASESIERLCQLIPFKSSAIYLVDENTSDIQLSVCVPVSSKNAMEDEMEFMIQNGFVAWAMRERRGISVYSKDSSHQILLHVMSTFSRIRGLFVGILPSASTTLPEASLEIASLILRNAANGIESILYSAMLRQEQEHLEAEVERKTKKLLHYERKLVQSQKTEAIAALAGGVAHQFNNALTGLVGNIDLISMVVQKDSSIIPYIERTRPIIERMSNLTKQLLAYARGGTFINTQVISLKDLLNEVLPSIKTVLKETVSLTVDPVDQAATLDVDLIQIRTAIQSIVNNADEAIADDGCIRILNQLTPWDHMPTELSGELKPGDYVCIQIEDSGTGMDEDTRRRLFEPFFSTKFEGRGLSMAAVSGIIKSHHGGITVFSQVGSGTVVNLFLPVISSG